MRYFTLPRTDLRVSSLCLGTGSLGADIGETDSFALLDQFFHAGGTFLDTAAIYAAWTSAGKGSSERLIAKWLASRRTDIVVGTKGGHPELDSMGVGRLSRREIEADIDDSLKNLGIEALDLWYFHRDDPTVPVEELLDILETLVAAGKIRYYGGSNWKTARMREFQQAAQARGARGFVANQPLWSLAQADLSGGDQTLAAMNAEMRDFHAQCGLAAVPYSSQAGGFFQKIAKNRPLSPSLEANYNRETVRALNRARLTQVENLGDQIGLSATQIVLGYLLSQPFPVVPIIGPKTAAQLEDSLSASEVKLSAEQVAVLEESHQAA